MPLFFGRAGSDNRRDRKDNMQFGSYLAVFLVVWWLTFVFVLPLGNRSQAEVGNIVAGTDPGAPAKPRIWMRVGVTTFLAMALTGLLFWGLSNETLQHYWNR
jgi:predicted secreted protein